MEQEEIRSWLPLAELPNEILLEIFTLLNRSQLTRLLRINKNINFIIRHAMKNKKKIRLCGDNLRVLTVGFNDSKQLNATHVKTSRKVRMVIQHLDDFASKRAAGFAPIYRDNINSFFHYADGRTRRVTLMLADTDRRCRQLLWLNAVAADLLLLVVSPNEIDVFDSEIREIVFGCCFMMSARNVIVAVDLHDDPSYQAFEKARARLTELLDTAVGQCYKIIPVDVMNNENITTKWNNDCFSREPTLKSQLIEDQMHNNFDENAYQKLCNEPLKIQFTCDHDVRYVGTVLDGHVIRGTLKLNDRVNIYPKTNQTTAIRCIQEDHLHIKEARPGNVIGVSVQSTQGIFRRRVSYTAYAVKYDTKVTLAFRASITVKKSDRFMLHHMYTVFHGPMRIRCILLWIVPEDGENNDGSQERKIKPPYDKVIMPQKPRRSQMDSEEYKLERQKYKLEVSKLMTSYVKTNAMGQVRPPKPTFKKVDVILYPFDYNEIETYEPSDFEKNYYGKVMLVEKGSIVAVGKVDRAIRVPHTTFNNDYKAQSATVMDNASALFYLPTEEKLFEMFLDVQNNIHARNSCSKQLKRYWHRKSV